MKKIIIKKSDLLYVTKTKGECFFLDSKGNFEIKHCFSCSLYQSKSGCYLITSFIKKRKINKITLKNYVNLIYSTYDIKYKEANELLNKKNI